MVTVSRAATSRINIVAVTNLFEESEYLGSNWYDNQHESTRPLYRNVKVLITRNRNKELWVVNGQTGTVVTMQNATVFIKLPNASQCSCNFSRD